MAKWIERDLRYAHYIAEGMHPRTKRGLTCAVCGEPVVVGAHNKNPLAASLDHMTARTISRARYDITPTNLVVLCARHNSSKGDDDMTTYLAKQPAKVAAAAWKRIGKRIGRKADMTVYIQQSRLAGYGKKK